MNKNGMNCKPLLVTELIFCNNPKLLKKNLIGFFWGNHGDVNFWVGLQKYVKIRQYFIEGCCVAAAFAELSIQEVSGVQNNLEPNRFVMQSYRVGTTLGWVNYHLIFIFGCSFGCNCSFTILLKHRDSLTNHSLTNSEASWHQESRDGRMLSQE